MTFRGHCWGVMTTEKGERLKGINSVESMLGSLKVKTFGICVATLTEKETYGEIAELV